MELRDGDQLGWGLGVRGSGLLLLFGSQSIDSRNEREKARETGRMKRKKSADDQPGRFAYEGLDRALHEKARLGIMTALVTKPDGLLFGDLKRLCTLTAGNLSRHLDVLREAGLVEIWKGFEHRRPQTLCRLSVEGRQRFLTYLEDLEQLVRDAMPKVSRRAERLPDLPPGWQLT